MTRPSYTLNIAENHPKSQSNREKPVAAIRKSFQIVSNCGIYLKLSTIKRQEGERFETLFQRIVAHIEDNLLSTESGLTHDGALVSVNEEMSPTTERLAVYLWLNLIDERLPSYVARVFAHDLQSRSLKDIQPQICPRGYSNQLLTLELQQSSLHRKIKSTEITTTKITTEVKNLHSV